MPGGKISRLGLNLGAVLLLAGCGGGGNVASTPTPTPSPSQSATSVPPPPASPVNASFAAPLKSETFNNLSARATGTSSSTALKSATAALQGTGATIVYDAAAGTYQFTSTGPAADGTSPERLTITTTSTDFCYTTPCVTSGNAVGTMARRGVEGSNSLGFLYTHVAFANWHSAATVGSDRVETMNVAVFGATTPAGGVPTTGTASYKLDIRGTQMTGPLGTSAGRQILPGFSGTGVASVDFANATYSMSGDLSTVLATSGTTSFSSTGRLSSGANGFFGNFTFADAGVFSGSLFGWFFGPTAQELGAVFSVSNPDGRTAVGTVVGHK